MQQVALGLVTEQTVSLGHPDAMGCGGDQSSYDPTIKEHIVWWVTSAFTSPHCIQHSVPGLLPAHPVETSGGGLYNAEGGVPMVNEAPAVGKKRTWG